MSSVLRKLLEEAFYAGSQRETYLRGGRTEHPTFDRWVGPAIEDFEQELHVEGCDFYGMDGQHGVPAVDEGFCRDCGRGGQRKDELKPLGCHDMFGCG